MPRITIEIEEHTVRTLGQPDKYLAYVAGVTRHSYRSAADARAQLRKAVVALLREGQQRREHTARLTVGCVDGTVLLVEWDGGWLYRFAGPERSCGFGAAGHRSEGFEATCQAAREHAEQCFGGVAWETRR